MAKYKINLESVWNLPVGTVFWRDPNSNTYCALGLIAAGIFGAEKVYPSPVFEQMDLLRDLEQIGLECIGSSFDQAMGDEESRADFLGVKPNLELIREKYVRYILQKGLAAGLFELEDSDLAIVRELKQYQNKEIKQNVEAMA